MERANARAFARGRDVSAEDPEQVVQEFREPARIIEKSRDRAKQVAEQIAGARLCRHVEDDPAQIHLQPEDIERKRTKIEMENVARRLRDAHGQRDRLDNRCHRAGGVRQYATHRSERDDLTVLHRERRDIQRAGKCAGGTGSDDGHGHGRLLSCLPRRRHGDRRCPE